MPPFLKGLLGPPEEPLSHSLRLHFVYLLDLMEQLSNYYFVYPVFCSHQNVNSVQSGGSHLFCSLVESGTVQNSTQHETVLKKYWLDK